MKKLSIIVLVLFFISLLAIPAYSDTQHKGQEDRRTEETGSEFNGDTENLSEIELEGRKVVLKDGSEVVIVDVPDSLMKETKVRFDKKNGKARVSCH